MRFMTDNLENLHVKFKSRGFDLRFVGGCVRDTLLGQTPKDVDLCTDATPEEQMKLYTDVGYRWIPTGVEHGTVTVVVEGEVFEVTTLRTESNHDGRYAEMNWTRVWEEDLGRRDLTINAMAMDFDGNLYDPFGGQEDLANRRVRFVGHADARIQEDYLRMLRWYRFHGRVAGERPMDCETVDAVRRNKEGLENVSRERVWMEVSKIAVGNEGPRMMFNMFEHGLFPYMDLPNEWNEEVFNYQLTNPVTFMTMLVDDVEQLAEDWKWSREERDLAVFLKRMPFVKSDDDVKYLLAAKGFDPKMVQELCVMSGWKMPDWEVPDFPVKGKDLLDAGMKPGPQMGKVLNSLKEVWARSDYTMSKTDLLENF